MYMVAHVSAGTTNIVRHVLHCIHSCVTHNVHSSPHWPTGVTAQWIYRQKTLDQQASPASWWSILLSPQAKTGSSLVTHLADARCTHWHPCSMLHAMFLLKNVAAAVGNLGKALVRQCSLQYSTNGLVQQVKYANDWYVVSSTNTWQWPSDQDYALVL